MSLTRFSRDMNIIAKLDDEPNDVGGLTAAQLKGRFDEGGVALQNFINTVLIPELEAGGAGAGDGVTVPTRVSQLSNDAGYQTAAQVSAAIEAALADFEAESLPDAKGVLF